MKFATSLLGLLIAGMSQTAFSMNAAPFPFRETQPDGSLTPLMRMNGNTNHHYLTDMDGYTVIEDSDNWYVYADDDGRGALKSSGLRVGEGVNPKHRGLKRGLLPPRKALEEESDEKPNGLRGLSVVSSPELPSRKLKSGHLRNLVILIRFSDHGNRNLAPVSHWDILFNRIGGDPVLAPSGSIRDVFSKNSYGKLQLESYVYPWITLPHTEAYYADKDYGLTAKIKEALTYALEHLKRDRNFSFKDFDLDRDGEIDAITFVHSGYAAEWGEEDCLGGKRVDRIWSHKHGLPRPWYSDGVKVHAYSVNPGLWGVCGYEMGRIGVIAHELGHYLDLPDLYDGEEGHGIGNYCLMADSWGFDGEQQPPPSMGAWSKIALGWVEPTVLSQEGTYQIRASHNTPMIYKITKGFPDGEYLLIENRAAIGFDRAMPQGGLAIWHIDEKAETLHVINSQEGFPGQPGWPNNGKHYYVALLQADGQYDLEQNNNRGDSGDLYHKGGKNVIGPSKSGSGPFPNTDSYQNGNIKQTNIWIHDISDEGETMTFQLSFSDPNAPDTPPTGQLETTFNAGSRNFGNMFDVVAVKDIVVDGMDIHVLSKDYVTVEIYTKSGSADYAHNKPHEWKKIGTTRVQGRGFRKITPLPPNSFDPVEINAGEKQSFYVTLSDKPDMLYTVGSKFGDVYASNSDVKILVGYGKKYPFKNVALGRVWNGVLHYSYKSSSTKELELETTFTGKLRNDGTMFDVIAKNDIIVDAMDIHIGSMDIVKVEVYTKSGSFGKGAHKDSKRWTKIGSPYVRGKGHGSKTPLHPGSFESVRINAGETQAFYVTLVDSPSMFYSETSGKMGSAYASNNDMEISVALGKAYPFSTHSIKRGWNGVLHYKPAAGGANNGNNEKELETTFAAGTKSYGNMFEVITKKNIVVDGMDIHVSTTNVVKVEIYTKSGTIKQGAHKKAKQWTKIGTVMVKGKGLGNKTPLPPNSISPVEINAGERQAFYVTLVDAPDMFYSLGTKVGRVVTSNDDMEILEGYGKEYPFGKVMIKRVWNGVLHYSINN